MSQKTPAQLTLSTSVADTDLFTGYPTSGPMYAITAVNLRAYMEALSLETDGSTVMTAPLPGAYGSQAAPGYTFNGDADTGIYRVSANVGGLVAGGLEYLRWSAAGIAPQNDVSFVGPLTGNATTATAWQTARNLSFTGDATGTGSVDGSGDVATTLTLKTVNTNVGSFTYAAITVDGNGRITAAASGAAPGATVVTDKGVGYTAVLADANTTLVATNASLTFTIPAQASVNYPVGTFLEFYNTQSGTNLTIAITSDTLQWGSSSGSRTVGTHGVLAARKMGSALWTVIYGIGIS